MDEKEGKAISDDVGVGVGVGVEVGVSEDDKEGKTTSAAVGVGVDVGVGVGVSEDDREGRAACVGVGVEDREAGGVAEGVLDADMDPPGALPPGSAMRRLEGGEMTVRASATQLPALGDRALNFCTSKPPLLHAGPKKAVCV